MKVGDTGLILSFGSCASCRTPIACIILKINRPCLFIETEDYKRYWINDDLFVPYYMDKESWKNSLP